jgi:hypothetical protein
MAEAADEIERLDARIQELEDQQGSNVRPLTPIR